MYNNISQEFKEQLNNGGRNFKTRFLDMKGNVLDIIAVSLKLYSGCNEGAVLKLGGTISSYFDAELTTELTLYNMEVKLEIGLLTGDEYEWIPAGIYKFDKPEKNDTTVHVTAYDRMSYMMNIFFTRNNPIIGEHLSIKDTAMKGYPVFGWLRDLFEEYRLMGNVIDNTTDDYYEEHKRVNPSYNVKGYLGNNDGTWSINRNYTEGISAKELISNIATLFAGFAYFDRDGKLIIQSFGYGDTIEISGKYEQTISEAPFSASGIRIYGTYSVGYYDGEIVGVIEPDEEDTDEGSVKKATIIKNIGSINGESTFISTTYLESGDGEKITGVSDGVGKEQLAKILASFGKMKGVEFYAGTISFFGNILLDQGDIVKFLDKDGIEKKLLCTSITQIIDGGVETKIECVGLSESDSVEGASATGAIDYTQEQRYGFLWCQKLEAETVKIRELEAKIAAFGYVKTDELEAAIGTFGYIKTDELEAKVANFGYIKTNELQAEIGKYGYLTANEIDSKLASFGYVKTDELEAVIGTFGYLTVQQADIKYANIGLSNVTTENVGLLLNKVGMIDRATIVDGHITGFLDSVEINANRITAGTLIADRLLLRGSQQGLLYQLNNSGELTSTNVDTLDGTILTQRTVTADKLVAKSITANELDVTNIFANTEVVNTLVGNEAFINKIMSNQIIVGATNDAANALTKATNALSTAGTASSTASSALAAANTASTNANSATTIAELARMMMGGRLLYTDPTFLSGMNSVSVYNNSGNGAVSVARDTKSNQGMTSCPTTSGYIVRILVTGTATPGLGGFYQNLISRANAKFVVKYLINLPKGYKLCTAANSMGSGYTDKFIGDVSGTGTWKEYYRIVQCGASGTFSGGGHVYVVADGGAVPTASAPLVWYLGAIYAYDVTDVNPIENWRYQNTTYINGGHIYTGTIEAAAIKAGSIFTQELEAKNLKITGGSVKISTAASSEQNYIEFTRTYNSKTYKTIIGTGGISVSGDVSSASLLPGNLTVTVGGTRQLRFLSGVSGLEVRSVSNNNSKALMDYGMFNGYYNNTSYVQLAYDGTNFNYLKSKLSLGESGSIASGNSYAVTGGTVYNYLTSNYLPKSNGVVNGKLYWENTDWAYTPGLGIVDFRDARRWGQSYLYVGTDNGAFSIAWTASDEALKKNIRKTKEKVLDKIRGINFIEYDWQDENLGHVDLGISANQLENIIPSAVFHVKQPEGSEHEYLRNLNSQELTAYSLKAIQELYDIVLEQREIIEQLRNERQG